MIKTDEVLNDLVESGALNDFLDLVDPQAFDEFSRSVMITLRKAVRSLEQNANIYYNQSEEQLSTTIALLLESSGFKTKNEPSQRGHVDIFVEKDNFTWLIEAKIGYNNQKIFEGLLQLTSRYLTDQRSACLLLYFKKENIKSHFENWRMFLHNKEWVSYAQSNSILDKCTFSLNDTTVKTDGLCFGYSFLADVKTTSGETVDVYHVGANLHFCPFDTSGRDGSGLRKEQAKIYLEHFYHGKNLAEPIDMERVYRAIDDYFEFDKEKSKLTKLKK